MLGVYFGINKSYKNYTGVQFAYNFHSQTVLGYVLAMKFVAKTYPGICVHGGICLSVTLATPAA